MYLSFIIWFLYHPQGADPLNNSNLHVPNEQGLIKPLNLLWCHMYSKYILNLNTGCSVFQQKSRQLFHYLLKTLTYSFLSFGIHYLLAFKNHELPLRMKKPKKHQNPKPFTYHYLAAIQSWMYCKSTWILYCNSQQELLEQKCKEWPRRWHVETSKTQSSCYRATFE